MKQKSWQKQYFRNYLLIALIPTLLFVGAFVSMTFVSYRSEIEGNYLTSFSQFEQSMNRMLAQADAVVRHISESEMPDRAALLAATPAHSNEASETLVQRLAMYENQLGMGTSVFLYIRGDENIYTPSGLVPYQSLEQTLSPYGSLNCSGAFTAFSSVTRPTVLPLVRSLSQTVSGDMLLLLYPLPAMSVVPGATLCFSVRCDAVREALANCVSGLTGSLYLFRDTYREVMRTENVSLSEEGAVGLSRLQGTGLLRYSDGGRQYVVFRTLLNSMGLSVDLLYEESVFYARIHTLWRRFMLVTLSAVLLCAAVAVLLTKRSYRPLQKIVRNLNSAPGQMRNEFEYIQRHMDAAAQKNEEMDAQLRLQQPIVQNACLAQILLGKVEDAAEIAFRLCCAGIDLNGRSYFVLAVAARAAHGAALCEAYSDALHEALSAPVSGACPLYVMEDDIDGLAVALVVFPSGSGDIREKAARAILTRCELPEDIRATAGAGRLCSKPEELHDSCMEALTVAQEFLPGSEMDFACFEHFSNTSAQRFFPTLDCALLNQSLKQADVQTAKKVLEKIVQDIRRAESLLYTQCMCYDVINNMLRTIQSLQPQYVYPQLHALNSFHTVEEFSKRVEQLAEDFCAFYGGIREKRSSQTRNELITFVDEHVFRSDFGLEQVADTFKLSPSYLSRFYKQETGYTFTQYVTLLHLNRAKRLLTESNLSIREIVEQIGYIDTASFVRKFKACEGITPGQWRETYRV